MDQVKRCVNCARDLYRVRNDDRLLLRGLRPGAAGAEQRRAELIAAQQGRCSICDQSFRSSQDTHADHDHAANMFRSFLCARCNSGLGQFRDDPKLLERAKKYLEHHLARRGPERSQPLRPDELIAGDAEVTKILGGVSHQLVHLEDGGYELRYDVEQIRDMLRKERVGLSDAARAVADRLIRAKSAEWSAKVQANMFTHLGAVRRGETSAPQPTYGRRAFGPPSDPHMPAYAVAAELGVSLTTVANWTKSGVLPTVASDGGVRRFRVALVAHIKKALDGQRATADSLRRIVESLRTL